MHTKLTFLLTILSFFVISCGSGEGDRASADGMAKLAEDPAFQEKHEEPDSLVFEARGEMLEVEVPGGEPASAYVLMAEEDTDRYLFVFHEWWGLNDHIKAEAERLYDKLGEVNVIAPDLYDGKVADTREKAVEYVQAFAPARGEAIVGALLAKAGPRARVATIGWCFGGGWSLRASIQAKEKGAGCVIFYGMPVETAEELAPISCEVLGIFATEDGSINEEVVANFEQLCEETNTPLEVHWFEADHAFANPSSPRYQEEAAQKANELAWNFLLDRL